MIMSYPPPEIPPIPVRDSEVISGFSTSNRTAGIICTTGKPYAIEESSPFGLGRQRKVVMFLRYLLR